MRHADDIDGTRFCRPEMLLLDSLRLWSQDPGNAAYIRRRMAVEIGPDAAERAAKALKLLAHILGLHARRTIYLMRPGRLGASADERAILAMIGGVLHGRRGQAGAVAAWLLPVSCHGTVLALAGELGRAMRAGGLEIAPPRLPARPAGELLTIRAVA